MEFCSLISHRSEPLRQGMSERESWENELIDVYRQVDRGWGWRWLMRMLRVEHMTGSGATSLVLLTDTNNTKLILYICNPQS